MLDPDDVPAQGGGQQFARGVHRRRRHRHHLPPETTSPVATFLLFLNLPSLFCARPVFHLTTIGIHLCESLFPDSHCAQRDQTLHIREGLRLVSEQPERHQ